MNTIPVVCEEAVPVWGDADGNGDVEMADALLVLRYVLGLEQLPEAQAAYCDVNGDGVITATDALMIMRYILGLVPALPAA